MACWTPVAREGDIPEGEAIVVEGATEPVAVFNVGGTYHAISDMCPHAGGSLASGWVEGGAVQCPWHGWSFELAPDDNLNDGVRRYPTRTQDGQIEILLPEAPA